MSNLVFKITSIPELITASHEMAKEKGWWDHEKNGETRPWAEQHNNFYGEVSEAWEEYRAGRMDIWYAPEIIEHQKPEGFWVEVADLLIRMADTLGRYKVVTLLLDDDRGNFLDDVSFVASLYRELGKIADGPNGDFLYMLDVCGCVFSDCFNYAKKSGVDLYHVISLKMAFNQTRSRRHGGKKA